MERRRMIEDLGRRGIKMYGEKEDEDVWREGG